ncbi:QARS [Lepeophtheirus salmonis]|uniref:QARS n=1 Tax=Lepeophtheirus salmonis TaxID=72036 RepID=A0A7R8CDP0_LEPSM|nr:QARS [Lepeophtheirus salmonis]CAF2782664.1 QARS [Lepeophtheirus salmonis]
MGDSTFPMVSLVSEKLPNLLKQGFVRIGTTQEAVNNFVARLGVTGAQMTVDPSMLEASVRSYLNVHSPRFNDVPLFPDDPSKGTRSLSLSSEIYIEISDFNEVPEKGYRRLCPGQSVGLRYAGIVLNFLKKIGPNEIAAEFVHVSEVKSKPKAFIHWVDASDSSNITIRLYDRLFKHANPEDPSVVPGGFLTDVNPRFVASA